MIYVVQPGDSLYSIANRFGLSLEVLRNQNLLEHPERLVVGQSLLVLTPLELHTVRRGDTIYSIARRHVTTAAEIYRNNPQLYGMPDIRVGQTLVIRYGEKKRGRFLVNGYTYPYIDADVLRQVLPYLSTLSNFTYGVTENGDLITMDDVELLISANAAGVASIMVLAPLNSEGQFDNQLIASILGNPEAADNLITNVVNTALNKGYSGVDLDFEYIPRAQREAYVEFAAALANRLHQQGMTLNIALPPKVSDDQQGLLYEGMDYAGLGQVADTVLLMTYEWGYTYGPPMPVAPLPEVRAVVEYALTRIPAEKILLGIPNYGYDWTLPYEQGRPALSISTPQAVELAWRYGAEISYDPQSEAPYFYYFTPEGTQHVVWFEDLRSMQAKYNLALSLGLRGVSFWTIVRPFPANWLMLSSQFASER